MATLLIASGNPHKVEEIRGIFAECAAASPAASLRVIGLGDLDQAYDEPIEDGDTFEANALLKARYYSAKTGLRCLADDSGLTVDALDGRPGVYSARYSGVDGPRSEVDAANNRKLLVELEGAPVERRTARFVCAMALVDAETSDAEPVILRGAVEGRILLPSEATDPRRPERGRGENGFGYDPLFLLPERGVTTAELSPAEKNAISHRGVASRLIWPHVI